MAQQGHSLVANDTRLHVKLCSRLAGLLMRWEVLPTLWQHQLVSAFMSPSALSRLSLWHPG